MSAESRASTTGPERRQRCELCSEPVVSGRTTRIDAPGLEVTVVLCARHVGGFTRLVATWFAAQSGGRDLPQRRRLDKAAIGTVRSWAVENGYPVASKGSLSDQVLAAFYESHPLLSGDGSR